MGGGVPKVLKKTPGAISRRRRRKRRTCANKDLRYNDREFKCTIARRAARIADDLREAQATASKLRERNCKRQRKMDAGVWSSSESDSESENDSDDSSTESW